MDSATTLAQEAPVEIPSAKDLPLLSNAATFSPQTLAIVSFLAAILGLAIILLTRKNLKSKGNALLLVGAPDAGKTSILSMLAYGEALPTHTSIQVNSAIAPFSATPMKVIDVPGHPRIRDQFADYLANTKFVGFVVDANTISRNGAAVAEHLQSVLHALTSLPPSQSPPSLIIIAHKSDLLKTTAMPTGTTSHDLAMNRVKAVLERELEKRRVQSGGFGVEGLGAEGEESEIGGLECTGGTFKFDQWEGGDVVFIGSSAKKSKLGDPEKIGEMDISDGLWALQECLTES
ncbi:signal recognition particle receptor beta subunit-domain-containing protein [Mycena floridula]|nr:signal recognition particle receptor beta subunit-domain-containing protein [Mycena floridula]